MNQIVTAFFLGIASGVVICMVVDVVRAIIRVHRDGDRK